MTPEDKAYNSGLREAVRVIKRHAGNRPRGIWLLIIQRIFSKMKTQPKKVHYTVEVVRGQNGVEHSPSISERAGE